MAAIRSVLEQRLPKTGLIAHERQADALRLAADALDVSGDEEPEILADQLWQANRALEKLLGRIDVEDYLGHIFANFCIGK